MPLPGLLVRHSRDREWGRWRRWRRCPKKPKVGHPLGFAVLELMVGSLDHCGVGRQPVCTRPLHWRRRQGQIRWHGVLHHYSEVAKNRASMVRLRDRIAPQGLLMVSLHQHQVGTLLGGFELRRRTIAKNRWSACLDFC